MIDPTAFIHPSSVVDEGATIGKNVKIWHFCHIMSGAVIGDGTSIGQGCYVASDVTIGKDCKIQNSVNLYDGVIIEDSVYIGPSVIFVNVKFPKAHRKGKLERTLIKTGASIGANSSIVCGIVVGEFSSIGIGSVVTKSVPAGMIAFGNPAQVKKTKGYHP